MFGKLSPARVVLACAAVSATLLSASAIAQTVNDTAGNGSLATAINLDGNFGLASNPNIANSTTVPHVTILSGAADTEVDYFSFTVSGPGSGTFDMDGANFDGDLRLFDSVGNSLNYSDDDFSNDAGNTYGTEPIFSYTFTTPGTYYLAVGNCCTGPVSGSGSYQLHVSLTTADAAPEPGAWALMIGGFGIAGGALRRRRAVGNRRPALA